MKTTSKNARLLASIEAQGFDRSYVSADGGVRARCSQCEALVISGMACHETGCPNMVRDDDASGNDGDIYDCDERED